MHNAPGQIQHNTPPWVEQVPLRLAEQLYTPSAQMAVTGGVPLLMQTALDGTTEDGQVGPVGVGVGVGAGVGVGGAGTGPDCLCIATSAVMLPVTVTVTSAMS